MLLEVRDLKIYYGKVEAVKGVSLRVDEGDIVTLLGANGAGKTTTLITISGIKKAASGEIWYRGERIDGRKPSQIVKMGIGHVPEARRIFPYMNVEDNLLMGAYVRNDKEVIKQDLLELYDHFPILNDRKKQLAGTLSGGEQQMLAVGRALMCKPKLLLMDEPSVGLSPVMEEEIAEVIQSINRRGIAVLLVEQKAAMALRLARWGFVIETGRMVLDGPAEELLDNEMVKKAYLGG